MFARNMKILTLNTNNTSHIVNGGDGTQPITKAINNFDNNGSEGDRVESGAQSVSNHKTNKREQKHNTRSKFILNSNNIQQSITQEQQQKPQKYHHKNNNNNNNNAKQKSQHYNSKSSNSTLSANRKKYYKQQQQQQQNKQQQQHQQQHQHQQSPHFQNQQQQQHYIAAMQERIKSQINITINNNNSNLVANENYNIALHEQQQHHQQHQQQQQQNINKNNNTVNDSTKLLETRSCLLDQINCDKPPMPFSSTECSSSTASSLPIAKSDLNCRNQHPHIITYDNHYKSALSSTSETDLLNDKRITAPSDSVKFSKLAERQQLRSTTPLAKNNSNNLEEFVGNAAANSGASKCSLKRNFKSTPSASTATSSPAAILSTSSDDQPSNIVPPLVSENKLICKNSIISGGGRRAAVAVGGDNCRKITPSIYTVGEIIETTQLSKEKEHYASVNNLITNTSKVLGTSNKKKGNDAVLVSNVSTTRQKQLAKHQFPVEENEAMTSSSVVTPTRSTSIKPAIPNCKRSTMLCSSKTTTISEEGPQLDKIEKLSNPKVVPKSFSNNNSKNDIVKTSSAFSLKSTTSPQSSYSLDFLHSVGVKMTGLVLQTPETQGLTNGYGKQSEGNPSVSNNYSGVTTNRKQPRYLFGGCNNSNGNTDSLHYNYHHQPSQLTIASFLHKDLLDDVNVLTNESNTDSNGTNFLSSSNSRNNNNCKDHQQRQYMQVQGLTRGRYHQNYYVTSYQQPSGVIPNTNFGNEMGYNRELPSLLSNTSMGAQRNLRNGYLNFQNSNEESSMSKNHNKNYQRHPRQFKNSTGNYKNFVNNAQSKKKSYATSITSNGSSSSLKSILSNSSNISSHKLRTMASSESNIGTSKLNLANETLSSKMPSGSNERINHRGHPKNNSHHYSNRNNHLMTISSNVLQHQNYCNLTYIATSGTADGATNIGYSSALQSQATAPASANNCLNIKSQINSPSHVPILMSFNPNRFQFPQYHHPQQLSAQQQHLFHKFPHQQQQQNFLNKKIIVPLSLSIPSPTPSPKPIRRTANISINSQLAMVPGNSIMSCYPFDAYAAETPAAVLASSSEIIGGNDCDSDSCSNHSSTQMQYRSLTSVKSSVSTSPSTSSLASNTSTSAQDVEQPSYYGQSMTPAATIPPRSPNDYIYTNSKSFPDVQVTQQASLKKFHINNNGAVVSVLNLPTKSQNIYTDKEYQQQLQQHHQLYFNAIANQRAADHLNMTSALTAATNCSNNSSVNWSPSSHNNQFLYHQTNAGQMALLRSKTTSSSSGNSSISSISPPILQSDELQYTQQRPSACISSNEQLSNIILDNSSKADSGMSSNSSSASSGSFNGRRIKNNSTKGELTSKTESSLLSAKQPLLIGSHTSQSSSSNSSLYNLSDSTLTNPVEAFDEIVYLKGNLMSTKNEYSNQFQQLPQISTGKSGSSSANGIQQLPPPPTHTQHIFSFHQAQLHQSLPPPPATHNLLYNSPHTQHSRPLSSSTVPEFFTPPDRFLARAHLVEMKEAPSTLLNNSEWDHLSQDMWNKFIDSQQTKETFIQKMYLWRHLYLFIKNAYPRFGLYLVGSTISGFGSDSSDVDMCVVSRTASSIEPRLEALFNLTLLRDWLSKSGEFENFNLIEAKVPILRFSHRMHQLEIDLNFNNCVGIKNTHLLYCYSQLDWRVRPLVLIVKLWAQYHNINNAKNMTISSYSLVLMVIHFLQYSVYPAVLPCLHKMFPDKFPLLRSNDFGYVDMNETMRSYENENTLSIGELFSLFLDYYSFFDYTQYAISVRTGGILPISECRAAKSPKNDIHQWKILCIEEPFDLTNTARSVYDYQTFERVKVVFMNSKRILKETLDLNSVFSNVMQSYCSFGSFSILNDINPTATTNTNINFQDQVTDLIVTPNTCENCGDQSRNYSVECNDKSTEDLNDANNDEIEDDTNRKLEQNRDSNYTLVASENKLFIQKEFLLCTKNNRRSNKTIAPMLS